MKGRIYTVSQLNGYVKRLFERDAFLADVFVEGEISNLTLHRSGHIYFTLKDKNAQISCVMFSSYAGGLKFVPEAGMKVTVYGGVSLYEKTGAYQLYAHIMEPAGLGALYAAFEQLKAKLQKEGLFDPEHKKPIPEYPKTIAVLTSPTGAAVHDVISIAGRRNPNVEIVVVPIIVQGEKAADSIVTAISDVNKWKGCDLIILGRGGGSLEDLWGFNEEKVARAVYASKIPIISAVGHETDFTICDFAADLRAATPSAAAEIAVKRQEDLGLRLSKAVNGLNYSMDLKIGELKAAFDDCYDYFASDKQLKRIYEHQSYVCGLFDKLTFCLEAKNKELKNRLSKGSALLESLSPLKVLGRGYSIVTANDAPVTAACALTSGQSVNIMFKDGTAEAVIGDIYGKKDI